jgi:glycosyltransferase involved in cell wall biosynthesis
MICLRKVRNMSRAIDERKRKICLIAPSLQMGGIERAMSTLANYFVTKGHEVYFVTLLSLDPFFTLDERVRLYVPPYSFNRHLRGWRYMIYYMRLFVPWGYMRRTIKRIGPDVIMSFGDDLPQMSMLVLLGLKIPFYLSNRSSPDIVYGFRIRAIRWLAYFLKKPDGVIAQTSAAAERKKRILGEDINVRIIPNPARKVEQYNVKKQKWIVAVGRLHKEKGADRLMQAFAMLDAPDWQLVFAGTGLHADYLIRFARDLKIDSRTLFLGKVENIDRLLSESQIFVLPSYREGFPNALCEAMAAGLPCVAFDIVAGPGDIIDNDVNGYLIEDGDIEGMADKLQFLIDNDNERTRLGREAGKITERYSLERIGDMYLNFILQKYEE